jgi:regulator of sirC expression with transglutaminase-like and TPR domain
MIRRGGRWGTLLIALAGIAIPLREGSARPLPGLHETSRVSGTVESASNEHLVLVSDQEKSGLGQAGLTLTFVLTPDTQLLWGTQHLATAELHSGDAVIVRYYEQSDRKVVQAIWALPVRAQELSPTQIAELGAEAAYTQAGHLMDVAHVRQALPYLDQAILLRPRYLEAYGRRGYAYATLGMLEGDHAAQQTYRQCAIADYTTAIDQGMERGLMAAAWYNNRGVIYRQLEDNPHALQDFTMALQIEPQYISALQNRASLRHTLGDWEGALQDLTQVIGLEPQTGKWYCQRGQLWLGQEATTQAQQDFQRCLALDPSLQERYREAIDQLHRKPQG